MRYLKSTNMIKNRTYTLVFRSFKLSTNPPNLIYIQHMNVNQNIRDDDLNLIKRHKIEHW